MAEPPLDGPSAPLPVAAVARRMGVAPATLRTWDRRYGLGPRVHSAGAHRRYGPGDVACLEVMQRLLREGVPAGEAARLALAEGSPTSVTSGARTPPPPTEAGPDAAAVVRGLTRASSSLDAEAVSAQVRDQVRERGVIRAWDQVLRPVLVAAGDRWAATGRGVEIEHLLSQAISGALQQIAQELPTRQPTRPVLLASTEAEEHCLPQYALAAALAERGLTTRVLGPSMPTAALVDAVARVGPSAVFLWSQLPTTADPDALQALPHQRTPTSVLVGGPGWTGHALPRRVSYAAGLSEAVDLVLEATGH